MVLYFLQFGDDNLLWAGASTGEVHLHQHLLDLTILIAYLAAANYQLFLYDLAEAGKFVCKWPIHTEGPRYASLKMMKSS